MTIGRFAAALTCALVLSGCVNAVKTFSAHIRIGSAETDKLAQLNAVINSCVAANAVDKQKAYELSLVVADYLDLVVFDLDFYKQSYERYLPSAAEEAARGCAGADVDMPKLAAEIRRRHNEAAASLGRARAVEQAQILATLGNLGSSTPSYAAPAPQQFPPLNFTSTPPPAQNYLVQTRGGMVQCRVTRSNYVFCI